MDKFCTLKGTGIFHLHGKCLSPCRSNRRGLIFISVYASLAMILIYASALSMRTNTQQLVSDALRNRSHAMDLSQAAMEELREDFYNFFRNVYASNKQSDAMLAMQWLDGVVQNPEGLNPRFELADAEGIAAGAGTQDDPRVVSLPVGLGQTGQGSAWIVSVVNTDTTDPIDPLAPRWVTIQGQSTVGGITKTVRAAYEISLGVSDIFRYAYFVNNYGWFDIRGGSSVIINGEVRANGDLDFSSDYVYRGELPRIYVHGDLYAAKNPELINPKTGAAAAGTITGNPYQYASWDAYSDYKYRYNARARPARRVVSATQPAIGGVAKLLPDAHGWNSDAPEQVKYSAQAIQDMPYLGDLELYKDLAQSAESSLKIGSTTYVHDGAYRGIDGIAGTADDTATTPLVLIGTAAYPIKIDGPVVIPGDVIIRGVVEGRGTIYAGRNLHVVGSVTYKNPTTLVTVQRDTTTGQVRQTNVTSGVMSNLGTVCVDGTYVAPGGSCP